MITLMQETIKKISERHWQVVRKSGKHWSGSTLKTPKPEESRMARSMAARDRELPKICAMLDLDPVTMKPKVTPPTALKTRLELMREVGL